MDEIQQAKHVERYRLISLEEAQMVGARAVTDEGSASDQIEDAFAKMGIRGPKCPSCKGQMFRKNDMGYWGCDCPGAQTLRLWGCTHGQ